MEKLKLTLGVVLFALWVGVFFSLFFNINPVSAGMSSSVASWTVYSFVDMLNTITFYVETLIEEGGISSDE